MIYLAPFKDQKPKQSQKKRVIFIPLEAKAGRRDCRNIIKYCPIFLAKNINTKIYVNRYKPNACLINLVLYGDGSAIKERLFWDPVKFNIKTIEKRT